MSGKFDFDDDEPTPVRRRPQRETHVYIEHAAPRTDGAGVISLIFGILGVICIFVGCCIPPAYGVAIVFALIGLPVGFFGRGNLRIAGLVLNVLVMIPAIALLVAFLMFGVAALIGSKATNSNESTQQPVLTTSRDSLPANTTTGRSFSTNSTGTTRNTAQQKADREKAAKAKEEQDKHDREAREKADRQEAERIAKQKAAQAEKDAAQALVFAKDLLAAGKADKAKERLKAILDKYPDTKAAKEAAELLKKIDK